ncbi:unnamed protein product [Parnassius mnemosyne]|uniref:Homologous recombination OB-fold protein OB-fold domain-containing protein n=1 Tax=Parnassius mnemosyne TaxID=213953 RepID=A0AAV1KYT4_9NEOP
MFESDDFDQVLSQLDLPEVCSKISTSTDSIKENILCKTQKSPAKVCKGFKANFPRDKLGEANNHEIDKHVEDSNLKNCNISPKHTKRKIINSHFDSQCKRKFPGPAGLLTGSFEEYKDEDAGHIELLSQDIDFSQNPLQKGLFESTLWKRLTEDINNWNLKSIETIKTVKQLALNGNLKFRKAQIITALVESVDRSAMDSLVTLRDLTGNIKCTLHRDAWAYFSSYIVPEYSTLTLCKPTVLTTGSAFKKHYLNITLSNVLAVHSSIIVQDEEKSLPDGYEKVTSEDFTIIKKKRLSSEINISDGNESHVVGSTDLLDDLDNIFSDEIF